MLHSDILPNLNTDDIYMYIYVYREDKKHENKNIKNIPFFTFLQVLTSPALLEINVIFTYTP